jgi:hypothetical protein
MEQPSESTGKMQLSSTSAAKSAALPFELALIIDAWPFISPDLRSVVVAIAHSAVKASKRPLA